MTFFRSSSAGVEIFVKLIPKSPRNMIERVIQGGDGRLYLRVRVRAVPEEGKANHALEKLIADWLKEPRSHVKLIGGSRSRFKTVAISGDAALLSQRLLENFEA